MDCETPICTTSTEDGRPTYSVYQQPPLITADGKRGTVRGVNASAGTKS